MIYRDMTPEQRKAAYDDQRAAVELHHQWFCIRPATGSRADRQAVRHRDQCAREAAFIRRVAKSRGDAWAN